MVVRRLAAFFTLIAFVIFATTWIIRKLLGLTTADVISMFSQGVVIIFSYFIIGIILSKMGISLIREILDEKANEEEERRERARTLYLNAINSNISFEDSSESGIADTGENK